MSLALGSTATLEMVIPSQTSFPVIHVVTQTTIGSSMPSFCQVLHFPQWYRVSIWHANYNDSRPTDYRVDVRR